MKFFWCYLRWLWASASPKLLGSGISAIMGFLCLHWLLGFVSYSFPGSFGLYFRASILIYAHELRHPKWKNKKWASAYKKQQRGFDTLNNLIPVCFCFGGLLLWAQPTDLLRLLFASSVLEAKHWFDLRWSFDLQRSATRTSPWKGLSVSKENSPWPQHE